MIKVIVGYKLKKGADIQPILQKLNSYALTFSGFISAENIRSEKNHSVVAMQSNWEKLENWKAWESSKVRQQVLQEAEPLLAAKTRVTVYTIMPTSGWVYTRLKSGNK